MYPITATVTGSKAADYNITVVPGVLTITPAMLTVTAGKSSIYYGTALPTFTYTITGFVNGDTAATATTGTHPALPRQLLPDHRQAPIPITVTMGHTRRAELLRLSYVSGTLTILPAALTVTANKLTSTYGSALPAFTYTLTGLVNGRYSSHRFHWIAQHHFQPPRQRLRPSTYPITIADRKRHVNEL